MITQQTNIFKFVGKLPDEVAARVTRKLAVVDTAAHDLIADGRLEEMQKKATASDDESLQYTIEQSFQVDPNIDLEDTRALIAATRDHIASRSELLKFRELMATTRTTRK